MSHPIVFRQPAREEYLDAIQWHNAQEVGLGLEFESEIERVLATIAMKPKRYPVVFRDTREAIVDRFSYCVYYRVRRAKVIVVSIFHTSRDPSIWQDRI
jgi:toxin ParE1/3/4